MYAALYERDYIVSAGLLILTRFYIHYYETDDAFL